MRLVTTFISSDALSPLVYSAVLSSEGIDHTLEKNMNSSGEKVVEIWVVDEDQIDRAYELLESYRNNPTDKKFYIKPAISTPSSSSPVRQPSLRPRGLFTISILIAVIVLFFWSVLSRPKQESITLKELIPSPAISKVEKTLLYDDPTYFQIKDELITYLAQDKSRVNSQKAQELYAKLIAMPVWMGVVQQILQHRKIPSFPLIYEGPIFEKIRKGEVWRTVTPVLLHLDFLHIFFNLLWFLILAPQIEERIGLLRISLLFLIAAILPNTAQYLISGPFFMGLSGVVCAMAAFIWSRQKSAPWEGYLLQRSTIIVLAIFVGGLFILSFSLFWLNFFSLVTFSLPIANTAHIVGGMVGYLLGRSKFFASHI